MISDNRPDLQLEEQTSNDAAAAEGKESREQRRYMPDLQLEEQESIRSKKRIHDVYPYLRLFHVLARFLTPHEIVPQPPRGSRAPARVCV